MFNYKDCAFIEGSITWKQVSNQETVGGPIGGPGGGLQPGVLPGGGGLQPGVLPIGGTPGLGHFTGGQGGGREIHGKPDMALSSVILSNSLSEPIRVFARTSQTARSPHLPEFVVALNDIYLLNYIIFDPYPEELTETIESLGFSYTLEISRDSSHWKTLINYTGYYCYGRQYIILPTIAVR